MQKYSILFTLLTVSVLFSSCVNVRMDGDSGAPPADPSEGIVEANGAAAELLVEPETLNPGERAVIRVANHGSQPVVYGRPILVEKWDGRRWFEAEEWSRTMWTKDLLSATPEESGIEQFWPFSDRIPEPGWYRFSKVVNSAGEDSEALTIRGRIRVAD